MDKSKKNINKMIFDDYIMGKKERLDQAIKNPKKAMHVAKWKLNVFVGKKFFNNAAGVAGNLQGQRTLARIQKAAMKDMTNLNPITKELFERGHTLVGQIFEKKLVDAISFKFNKIIEDEQISKIRSEANGKAYCKYIEHVHKHIPEVSQLLNQQVIDIFEQYYQGSFEVIDINIYRNYHIPPEIRNQPMYSNDWHCDGHNTTWTKLMLYLTDVTKNDGPFLVQTIDRTKELMKTGFGSRTNPKLSNTILEDPNHATFYTGPKGTVLAANTELCLHRATIPAANHHRDMIQIQFKPSNEPLSDDWYIL